MIRRFTVFLLIITVLTANFSNSLIYAGFDLNQKYIASQLCENRDKPEMHCNGKCYLAKKVKQAEEKEKSLEQQAQKNRFQEALMTRKLKIDYPSDIAVTKISFERASDLPKHSSSIFHPPKV
ncbi:MAG TPA: hypothetical protein DIT07_05370 [Sphingobacteriaceae bacterium]|nr:hypothetical protein [Sphingobacteriaceae bacterium]